MVVVVVVVTTGAAGGVQGSGALEPKLRNQYLAPDKKNLISSQGLTFEYVGCHGEHKERAKYNCGKEEINGANSHQT